MQPRVGRSRGQALVGEEAADLVGRGKGKLGGHDSIDFPKDKAPGFDPDWSQHPTGMDALDGRSPYIMIADGKASLFAPSGMKEGRCRPITSRWKARFSNALYGQQSNPVANRWERPTTSLPAGRSTLPLCLHHVSADRTPFRRHADTLGPDHGGVAAGRLRRDPD